LLSRYRRRLTHPFRKINNYDSLLVPNRKLDDTLRERGLSYVRVRKSFVYRVGAWRMYWLRKYWQAMVEAATAPPMTQAKSGLRVDVAGCRVTAPPVKQKQRAFYISRKDVLANSSVSTGGATPYENKQAEKGATTYGAKNQDLAFDEWFAAPVALADDVLFVPISPATGATGVAVAIDAECQPMPRFV
jgi:hypothetical protein